MLARSYFTRNTIKTHLSAIKRLTCTKRYSSKATVVQTQEDTNDSNLNQTLDKIGSKYKIFKDSDSVVIPDIYEDRFKYPGLTEKEPQIQDTFDGLNLKRGVNGVFEIEDLIDVLEKENSQDLFVAALPEDLEYVDFICIVTGKSYRHMQAIAQFVRRVYKKKCDKDDIIPRVEGETSKEWMALDLGNIALHIFSKEARVKYDLDMLWAVGCQYDGESNKEDPVVEMLERHSIYLKDLKPAR